MTSESIYFYRKSEEMDTIWHHHCIFYRELWEF